jgi:putative transposase
MPRRPRTATAGMAFHVFNRAVEGLTLFPRGRDYDVFVRVLAKAQREIPIRLIAYAVMPNHWHLVVWPADGALSAFMKRLTATHAQVWRTANGSRGRGAVYQGRFKAIAVQQDGHLIRVLRYVERNPVRAKLVESAELWPWASCSIEGAGSGRPTLVPGPVPRPSEWLVQLNAPESPAILGRIRAAVRGGRHYGTAAWRYQVAKALGWRQGGRGPGRTWKGARPEDHD